MRAVRGGVLRALANPSRVSGRSASFSNKPNSFAANKCLLIMNPAAVWRMRSGEVSFIYGLAPPHRATPACANGNEGGDLRQLAGNIQRAAESINSRKPVLTLPDAYPIGAGQCGAWHPDKRSSRGISLHAWIDIRSILKNLRL